MWDRRCRITLPLHPGYAMHHVFADCGCRLSKLTCPKNTKMQRRLHMPSALRAAFAIAACAARVTVSAGAAAQFKLGSVLSITGPASFLGDPEKKTLEIYIADINAKGGVNGQKLQLVVYD